MRLTPVFISLTAMLLFVGTDATTRLATKDIPNIVAETTKEVVANPEIERIVKSLPADTLPKANETNDDFEVRHALIKKWAKDNLREKAVKIEAVVIGPKFAAFRIEGMDKSIVTIMGGYPQKKGDHVFIEGKLRNLLPVTRGGETWYMFTITEPKVTAVAATQPAK